MSERFDWKKSLGEITDFFAEIELKSEEEIKEFISKRAYDLIKASHQKMKENDVFDSLMNFSLFNMSQLMEKYCTKKQINKFEDDFYGYSVLADYIPKEELEAYKKATSTRNRPQN